MSGNHDNLRRIKEIITPERLWNPLLLRTLQLVAVPAVILLAAALAVAASHALPRSLSGLIGVGPYIVLLLGTAISAWFNRSRALIMLASLLRSEEHTSELQSLAYLVCRLLLEKKKSRQRHTAAC